jgi:hypothetical protein
MLRKQFRVPGLLAFAGAPAGALFPVGAYSAAQNCREEQFRESLMRVYRGHPLLVVMAITKRREASSK